MTWTAGSALILCLALAAGFWWYERTHPSARTLALIASLAALAALGRIAFAPLPNVKPTTDIVLIAGYALGGAPGFVVGAVGALASNLFFGQGPWTPWQMVAWGLVGLGGAGLARIAGERLGRIGLAAACGVAGLLYGTIMNVSLWVTYSGHHTWGELTRYAATSFPFDMVHVIGNVVFCLAFGPALVGALKRFRARLEIDWRPLPAATAAAPTAILIALLSAQFVIAPPAKATSSQPTAAKAAVPASSLRYLLRAQNADGGFGPAPGSRSTGLHTGWAALGLAASGADPGRVSRRGRDIIDYLNAHAREVDDLGEIERTILVLRAARRAPRLGGRNLVSELLRARRGNGSFAGRVNTTSFAILALRAAGRSRRDRAVSTAATFVARQQNRDGGFSFATRGAPSGVDDTSAAVMALVSAGRRGSTTVRRAVAYLERRQNADGGFPLQPPGASNAQSTAFVVQAFVAAGRNPDAIRRGRSKSPTAYLRSLIMPSGAVRYSRTSAQTPVWVTAQALTALARKAFPLQ